MLILVLFLFVIAISLLLISNILLRRDFNRLIECDRLDLDELINKTIPKEKSLADKIVQVTTKQSELLHRRFLWELNRKLEPILNRHYGMASIPSLFGREEIPIADVVRAIITYLRIEPYNDQDVLVFHQMGKGATTRTAKQILARHSKISK